ncbi:AraC family transcriptional regulator [Sphingomonas sp. EC-HK361]|uniref:AraC family transcriptional regulator n=1 Tax=Sphingomonas sp. EC-HK361 TaxID=2038397 RepID=UPI001254E14A|nr:AraC family transcriptional regulator [Sphingomonas sp. EC-HK361]VVT13103.1 AraC family transcriptional regulator [Sphingomonas sp. EC-HK361]
MGGVALDYRVPAEDLQPFVTLFYHFRADVPVFDDIERADHAQLRFRLSRGDGDYRFPDGSSQPATAVHILGPTTGAIRTRAAGPVEVVGLGLQPAGWAAMLGIDASTMHNRVVDGALLFGDGALEALVAMRNAPGDDAKMAFLEGVVRRMVADRGAREAGFAQAIDAWLTSDTSPDIDDLVALTRLSRRQIERRCKALYGAPPKVLARKYRALRAAVALASGHSSADILIGEGFYDQSHLIRELKQFTGLTPRQIRTEPGVLARLTIDQRHALSGMVSPLISET